ALLHAFFQCRRSALLYRLSPAALRATGFAVQARPHPHRRHGSLRDPWRRWGWGRAWTAMAYGATPRMPKGGMPGLDAAPWQSGVA
ncbi:MAG: hypothetical protein AAF674_22620, partial [Pseudomonadota bacterium]